MIAKRTEIITDNIATFTEHIADIVANITETMLEIIVGIKSNILAGSDRNLSFMFTRQLKVRSEKT